MEKEPTIGDVLKAVQAQESRMDQRIDEVLEATKTFSEHIDRRFDGLETRMTKVENRLEGVENKLDRTDGKVNALINVLEKKTVITTEDKGAVLA